MTDRTFELKERNTHTRKRKNILLLICRPDFSERWIEEYGVKFPHAHVECVKIPENKKDEEKRLKKYMKNKGICTNDGDIIIDLRFEGSDAY